MDLLKKDNLTDLVQFVQQETKPTINTSPTHVQPNFVQQAIKPGQAITEDGRIVTLGFTRTSHK